MNPQNNGQGAPWLLVIGLVLGGALLVFMSWGSLVPSGGTTSNFVIALSDANWQTEVLDSEVPVLVDFTAEWCGPCKAFAPTVHKLAERYHGKIKVGKFDVGDQSFNKAVKIRRDHQFSSVPTLMVFKAGKVHYQSQRGGNEGELVAAIEQVLQ